MASAPPIPTEDFYTLVHSVVTQLDALRSNVTSAVHEHRTESLEVLHALQGHLASVAQLLPPPSTTAFQRFYSALSAEAETGLDALNASFLLSQVQAFPTGEVTAADNLVSLKSSIASLCSSVCASSFLEKLNQVQLGYFFFTLHQKFAASKVATASASTFYAWLKQNSLVPASVTMENVRASQLLYNFIATFPRLLFCNSVSSEALLKHRSELLQHFAENVDEATKFRAVPVDAQRVMLRLSQDHFQTSETGANVLAPLLRPIEADVLKKVTNILRLQDMAIQTHFAAWAQDPSSPAADALVPRLELLTEANVNPAAKSNNFPTPSGMHVQLINYATATQPPAPTKVQSDAASTATASTTTPTTNNNILSVSAAVSKDLVEHIKAALTTFKSSAAPSTLVPDEALKKESSRAAAAVVSAIGVPDSLSAFLSNIAVTLPADSSIVARWKLAPPSVQAALVTRTLHGVLRVLEDPESAYARLVTLSSQLQLWKIQSEGLSALASAACSCLQDKPTSLPAEACNNLNKVLQHCIALISPSLEATEIKLLQGKSWKSFWATFSSSSLELHGGSSSSAKKIDLKKVFRVAQWTKSAYPKVEPPTAHCLVLVPTSDPSGDSSGESEDSEETTSALTRFLSFNTESECELWAQSISGRIEALAIRAMFAIARKSSSKNVDAKPSRRATSRKTEKTTDKSEKLEEKSEKEKTEKATKLDKPAEKNSAKVTTPRKEESSEESESSSEDAAPEPSPKAARSGGSARSTGSGSAGGSAGSRAVSTRIQAGKIVEDVLLDDTLYVGFRKFLADRQAAENLLFFKAAHNFKSARKKGLKGNAARQRAEDVYDKYLSPASDDAVTIAPKTLENIEALLWADNDPPANIFMAAASEVSHLVLEALFHQFLPTFKQSPDAPQPR